MPTPARLDDGYDIRDTQDAGVGKESARTAVPVFHRLAEGLRLHTSLAGASPLRSTAADGQC